jgi:hypothetical protein
MNEDTATASWVLFSAVPAGLVRAFKILPRTNVLGLEFLHFQNQGGGQRPLGTIVCDRLQHHPCQPRTSSPGKRVFKPAITLYLATTGL